MIIPTLNEAADIASCLGRIEAQTWPKDQLEVLIADGASDDDTVVRAIEASCSAGLTLHVVPNPERRTSVGLNLALAQASGDVVVRVDARSRIGPNHLELAAEALCRRPDVGVVGGGQRPSARGSRLVERAIARALANRFTTGLASYRRATAAGPADTVWMGSFRTRELQAIGGWANDVALNEDYELNERYRTAGFLVWFDPQMDADYLPRPTLRLLGQQYFRFGRVKGSWWTKGKRPSPRQIVLLATPPLAVAASAAFASQVGILPALLAIAVAAALIDEAGTARTNHGDGPAVRAMALVSTAVFTASWWSGVVSGAAGNLRGAADAR